MPITKFKDLSTGSKYLVLFELLLFMSSIALAIHLNNAFGIVQQAVLPSNIFFIYALSYALIAQLSSLALGLYNSKLRESFRGLFRRIMLAIAIAFSIATIINPLYGDLALAIELLGLSSCISLLFIGGLRYFAYHVDIFGFNKRNVLVLGAGERASIIEKRMRRDVDRQGFKVHGFVVMEGDSKGGIERETRINLEESLVSYCLEHDIDEIVVASDERRNNLPVDELFACKIRGVDVTEILDFIERETGQIAVNLIYPSWVIYSNGFTSTNYLRNTLDWLFNATIAFFLLLITWPVMLITAILIKLDDGLSAPIFYRQERVGVDGQPFYIVKFRSMRVDAEKDGAKWAAKNDDRTTRIGHFIRKYRIDELPQIYNVMRGDMGFVGPRPERPEFVQNLVKSIPYYNERHNVKPGLAGWAQLKYPYGATEEDALEKLKYDLYYIKHRSFFLDLLILIRTFEIVVFGKRR
ncbi:TIGR03013 family XrtA/PEP-CTERM system glycosyltransferase [Thalassotalea euphylliae]|uniref:TIGR03013 family XrtA/PEP-CTERM system glycosyltransferase n=1 Tax=Thalassotalea euphylliae TaxID=1655234 RepID=UPI00363923A5